ncbi:hypothetical protein B0I37DRAFT_371486 [Chaetomium sp. MPI-CAGE-AT-0009]|nr:hypothetical protein B0I37DRAFT_371486 [Chaetomium sp. MPI-CAGE-AT-0009]
MSQYKDILKKGWPEKDGTGLRGQMKSLVGRGEDTRRNDHVATPITSLRTAAEPTPNEPPAPPKPWRLDTTGLSTSHLPPPPGRTDGANNRPAPPPPPTSAGRAPPSLPPRLPPRSSTSSPATPSPSSPALPARQPAPGPEQGYLNQSAVSRLGAAGISVPGFGITPTSSSSTTTAPPPPRTTTPTPTHSHMNELQSRFSQLKTSIPFSKGAAAQPTSMGSTGDSGGTTLAQKQAAVRTAAAFRADPSSVSLSDARAAASTAENFRQRHGEQVAGGLRAAAGLQQRFAGGVGMGVGVRVGVGVGM